MKNPIIQVLLADDHAIVRDGIKMLLSAQKDIKVIAVAENGDQAIQLAKEHNPDVVLMDISMPILNGLEATKEILRTQNTKVVLLSMYTEEEYVMTAIRAGVSGYLDKQSAASTVIEAIRAVMKGEAYFSPSISKTVLKAAKNQFDSNYLSTRFERLTKREKQILQLIAEGGTANVISKKLFISVTTVYKHRQNIMNKTEIRDVAGLTRFAIENNLIRE
ncbi:MAG: response regulator transcription factor [Candidatus Marinimicrobia bacterium]|nr:response regulator transcription factor [Candidatus Neomarinimicrobiota bacterium]